jgi:hypothetical protein
MPQSPIVQGTVNRFVISPEGDVDGLILEASQKTEKIVR